MSEKYEIDFGSANPFESGRFILKPTGDDPVVLLESDGTELRKIPVAHDPVNGIDVLTGDTQDDSGRDVSCLFVFDTGGNKVIGSTTRAGSTTIWGVWGGSRVR